MRSIARIYIEEIRRRFDDTVVPIFAPDTDVSVGSIGSFEDGRFITRGSILDRGAEFAVTTGEASPVWTYSSQGETNISPAVETRLPDGSIAFSAKLGFSGAHGVVASFQDVVESRTSDADDFDRVLWELFLAGKLRADRVVVWVVSHSRRGTVVVTNERGASVDLTAPALAHLALGGLSAGVSFGASRGVGYTISNAPLTLYVRLKQVTPSGKTPVADIRRFDADQQERLRRQSVRNVSLDDVLAAGG